MVRQLHHAALALLLLAACGGPPTKDRDKPSSKDGITVTLEIDYTSSQPIEGELATFIVTVKNTGDMIVLLRDLVEGSQTIAKWQYSLPGTLKFREGPNEFVYDPRKPDKTSDDRFAPDRPVFNTSLIVPGEEIIFKPRIRLLDLPREYTVNYWSYGLADVKNEIYFLEDRLARPMKFKRVTDDRALEKLLLPDPAVSVGSHRTVIFPHAEKMLYTPKRLPIKLDAAVEKRAFTRELAMQKARLLAADVKETSYYGGLDVWAFRTDAACVWVAAESVITLPRLDNLELFCYALDSAGLDALSIELRVGVANVLATEAPQFKIIATPDPRDASRNRYHALVRKPDLLRFLDTVRGLNYKIEVTSAESGFRILVTH